MFVGSLFFRHYLVSEPFVTLLGATTWLLIDHII